MNYLLSLDCGTTASKISLFNEKGELLSLSTQEYPLITPDPLVVEIGAETLWNAFKIGVSDILSKSKIDPKDIRALGISAQGETLIPIDKQGEPLRNAIVWLDNRAQDESEILDAEFNDGESYKITGQVQIVPTWPASKVFWMKRHEKDIFKKVYKYLLVEDYLIWKMTGKFVAEGSLLCSTCYWDINTKKWWSEMLDYLDVSEDQLPEIWESGQAVGELRPDIASELGLSSKTIVATGALDQAAGAVGVGNIKPGIFSENTGAALAICAPLEKPIFDPDRNMPIHYFAVPDSYMAHTFTTGGMVLRWFRDKFCQPEMQVGSHTGIDPYDLIGTEVGNIPPGCEGLVMLPHLQGAMAPESNPKAKGVFYGFTLRHTKAHFARSIMESIACIVRRNVEVMEALDIKIDEIRVLGGGSRSDLWNQIKADVTQKPLITTTNSEAACLGAAILAGKAVGIYKDIEDACENMISVKKTFEPNDANFDIYTKTYKRYNALYNGLRNLFEDQ